MISNHFSSFLRLFLLALCFGAMQSWARPALRKPCDVKQPDGTILTIQLVGDEFRHFTTTIDDYTVVKSADGFYRYAFLKDGKLIPSDVVASNPERRTLSEQAFLARHSKMIAPEMTQAQKELQNAAARLYTGDMQQTRRAKDAAKAPSIDYSKFKGLVLLVEFSDRKFLREDANEFYQLLTNEKNLKGYYDVSGTKYTNCDGSVRDYFYDNSMQKFDPKFDVVGPVSINYKATDAKGNDNIYSLIRATLNAANSQVDYADYDLNKDGSVDMVYFIFAGYGSYVPGNDSLYVWPHASDLSWYSTYGGLRYDGMKFSRYACSVEIQDLESQAASHQVLDGIGTMCHEFSHVLGLADHYDTDYEKNGQAVHPGTWDVMANGADFNNGLTPAGYNSYERYTLGFAPLQRLEFEGKYTLEPFNTSNQFYLLKTGTSKVNFYLENRQKIGWDRYLPSHGLLVWRVDSTNANVWQRNTLNCNPDHLYYDLIRSNPSKANMMGSDNDPFPGKNNVIDLTRNTTPALLTWQGKEADIDLYDITETSEGLITFTAGIDLYKSQEEDFEDMALTEADAEGLEGKFCKWDLTKAIVANVADEGHGNGTRVVKVMRSGTITTSAQKPIRSISYNVWSGGQQARVALRVNTGGSWKNVKLPDGGTQYSLARNSSVTLSYNTPIPAGSKVQIQITGTSTAMVAYVDDIAITYGNDADGISEVEVATSSGDGSRYNLSGQKVDGHYKGIVISNGKKTIEK